MKVKKIMHKGAEWVTPDTSAEVLARIMRNEDIGSLPVHSDGRVVGIVTDRDIVVRGLASGRSLSQLTAFNLMTAEVSCCHDSDDIDDALEVMENRHIRRLPVLDRQDRLVGMLSIGDISSAAPRDLTGELMQSVSAHHG